ncbi:MAG TPA: adenylate/guanylate cyclase domain-containing protein [Actinomycetota bacterium]|nr:adenylate/guanylate cyclase domain-containing protein [Actinomycetota bacterium]
MAELLPEGKKITVFLAEDNLFVREGVRALLSFEEDLEVVGTAADYDELLAGVAATNPQVLVTDIRMPPSFQTEGIDAAKQVRKRNAGTGVVILSQYDDPNYAISLLSEGAEGYAYLLKDRVAEGDQLAQAIREVASGGSKLDPKIVEALISPVADEGELSGKEEELLRLVAEGRPIKRIAAAFRTTPADVSDSIERLFLKLAQGASSGASGALQRLKMLHQAIVELDEQGESMSRLLPGGVAEKLRREGRRVGETEKLTVTVLMSDIRGYSTIAEETDPSLLAGQLNIHRIEMNRAVSASGGNVWQFVGDAVMAVFGAPIAQEDHADRSLETALAMHAAQDEINRRWRAEGLAPFEIGIGLSTGEVAAALLGSEEHLEYSLVGDTVNLAQRLQQWADPGQVVLSEATYRSLGVPVPAEQLPPAPVKGRSAPVLAYKLNALEQRSRL